MTSFPLGFNDACRGSTGHCPTTLAAKPQTKVASNSRIKQAPCMRLCLAPECRRRSEKLGPGGYSRRLGREAITMYSGQQLWFQTIELVHDTKLYLAPTMTFGLNDGSITWRDPVVCDAHMWYARAYCWDMFYFRKFSRALASTPHVFDLVGA